MYYSNEIIEKIKQIDLLTYLSHCDPNELVRVSNNNYHTRTHDSLKISNGKWYWFSRNIGGVSALDYLIKVQGYSFTQAVAELVDVVEVGGYSRDIINQSINRPIKKVKDMEKFTLPKANANNDKVINYLIKERCIHPSVVKYYIDEKTIYESANFHSCIFVSKDENGVAKFATQRGTTSHFHGDCKGSDKSYPFSFINKNYKKLFVFEASIDMLSYQSFLQQRNLLWHNANYIALSGVYKMKELKSGENLALPIGLQNVLDRLDIKSIVLCFDNDNVGKGASEMLKQALQDKYEVIIHQPKLKDFNEDLVAWKQKTKENKLKKDMER